MIAPLYITVRRRYGGRWSASSPVQESNSKARMRMSTSAAVNNYWLQPSFHPIACSFSGSKLDVQRYSFAGYVQRGRVLSHTPLSWSHWHVDGRRWR